MWLGEMVESPRRCEVCGALRVGDECDHHSPDARADVLRVLAQLNARDPIAAQIVLWRVMCPRESYRALAARIGCSKTTIADRSRRLLIRWPAMRHALRAFCPHALGQRRRRQRERPQVGSPSGHTP